MSQHAYTLPYEHLEDLMTNFILTESLQALLLSMGMSYTHMPLKEYRHLFLKKLRALLALDCDKSALLFIFNITMKITS